MKKVVFTIDLEEFDTPLDHGIKIDLEEQLKVSTEGMLRLKDFFDTNKIPATIFCTGQYAIRNKQLMKDLAACHEIGSHTMYHGSFDPKIDLVKSREVLSKITGQQILGFRMPRMANVQARDILEAGFAYSASINPTFIPGRYNNLNKPKFPFREDGLLQIPATVSPLIRFPLFWLSFKNLPLCLYQIFANNSLNYYETINLYFHPWEFADLSSYEKIPKFIRKISGKDLLLKLSNFTDWLRTKNVIFTTFEKVYLNYD
ncbi:MAG TPA: polysaccharide deacetylase [Lentisphaeria bacterium]|nr:MAG: hypothetical protein A2X47_06415 [Lentisphaerae bacterium GWF2_38_69]HBM15536.1 polysaccharide deacetylase [Lentisphaeria bacterium]